MPPEEENNITITEEESGQRLDRFLGSQTWAPTRSQIKNAIQRGEILVNGHKTKVSQKLHLGDLIEINFAPPADETLVAEDIPLNILYEDDDLIVVNKPSGMVVHPAPAHPRGTLVNALLHHCGESLSVFRGQRPGIVHRIDKDTSGGLVIAKTVRAYDCLAKQFSEHTVERVYLALCFGPNLEDKTTFNTLHGRHFHDRKRFSSLVHRGKHAITHIQVLERFEQGASLLACRLETGRTHQIRVHLADNHAPLFGDGTYGGKVAGHSKLIQRTALHARRLGFLHPDGQMLRFNVPSPKDFSDALTTLRKQESWR